MVKLRRIGEEFTHPDQFNHGAYLHAPYLNDLNAYREYLNGDLSKLFTRMAGNEYQQDITGAILYREAGPSAYWQTNLFRAQTRAMRTTTFQRNPTLLGGDDTDTANWEALDPQLMFKALHTALENHEMAGRGVLQGIRLPVVSRNRQTGEPVLTTRAVLTAVDPVFYHPIMHPINREIQIGDAIVRLWFERGQGENHYLGQRMPNRAQTQIQVTEQQALLSGGRVQPMNIIRNNIWAGDTARGAFGSQIGQDEENIGNIGIWTFGDDDSIYKTMERSVYEYILCLSHMRTALTQDVRSIAILPDVADRRNIGADGQFQLKNRLRPTIVVQPDSQSTLEGIGYPDPPGPMIAEAFAGLLAIARNNVSQDGQIPSQMFGMDILPNEPAEMINKINQVFISRVIDVRDEMGRIQSEFYMAVYPTRERITVGWEHEPFMQTRDNTEEAILLHNNYAITDETLQIRSNSPVEEITPENNSKLKIEMGGNQDAIDNRPSIGPGGDIV